MINDEFLIKIEAIIKYLEQNGGYNYKVYNYAYPDYNNEPYSNIVEFAKDIKDCWITLKYSDNLETYIKTEICEIIMDNLKLFSLNDSKLINLKEYCKAKSADPISPTPNDIIMSFVHEALLDLLNSDFLYDFRNIE